MRGQARSERPPDTGVATGMTHFHIIAVLRTARGRRGDGAVPSLCSERGDGARAVPKISVRPRHRRRQPGR